MSYPTGSSNILGFVKRLACFVFLSVPVGLGESGMAADDLANQLQPLINAHDGDVGVAVLHIPSGDSFEHRADKPMPTASLIKFPLMIATFQAIEDGKLRLDQTITLTEADRIQDSGTLTVDFSPGTTFLLSDVLRLMIVYSENTATNLIADRVGLPTTAKLMERLGCPETKLHSKVTLRSTSVFPERSKKFGLGSTTAAEMIRLFTLLHEEKLVSPEASKQMMQLLFKCADGSMCKRDLPRNTNFAHKTGAVSASRTDAGIIESPSGPIAICVLTTNNEDRRWTNDNKAQILAGRIARIAYDHFNVDSNKPSSTKSKALAIGATGHLVEALQRTLNDRIPSLDIGVDGDFGPQTASAVITFQRENNLPETGEVDKKTWDALGTLVSKEPDQPSPEVINSQKIKRQPPDPLDGPPFVSCKAWAIGDAEKGKLLWGYRDDEPRDMASTTKIMTAFVVLQLAEQDSAILDEKVTFSQRADDTIGSTAGVRAGESLSVRELLYGLMLPSGNDASVALAEHFGPRLVEANAGNAYDKFIFAMNRTAKGLGMNESGFENPNGLTAPKHKTSPRDLLTLTHAAMQSPLFRDIVSAVQHGTTVEGLGGYQRNLVWRNTNRLLKTEGYNGVKTGTTSAAGSCLVSHGTRGEHSLVVVVLGASGTDARYADSRNLYRWAWQQLDARK